MLLFDYSNCHFQPEWPKTAEIGWKWKMAWFWLKMAEFGLNLAGNGWISKVAGNHFQPNSAILSQNSASRFQPKPAVCRQNSAIFTQNAWKWSNFGWKRPPKIQKYQKHCVYANFFEKFAQTSARHMGQNPTESVQKNLFRWTFF